jgi:hypothetical protein
VIVAIIGLPQGFVRFGTLAHRVLVAIHEYGPMTVTSLKIELPDVDIRALSTILGRLEVARFVFDIGRVGQYESGERTQTKYDLQQNINRRPYKCVTHAQRSARYREKNRRRVASVFDFRSTISIGK